MTLWETYTYVNTTPRSHTHFESEWGSSESPKQHRHWNIIIVLYDFCAQFSEGCYAGLVRVPAVLMHFTLRNKARCSHSCAILHAVITSLMLCWRCLQTNPVCGRSSAPCDSPEAVWQNRGNKRCSLCHTAANRLRPNSTRFCYYVWSCLQIPSSDPA
jgi:hypothetical protein